MFPFPEKLELLKQLVADTEDQTVPVPTTLLDALIAVAEESEQRAAKIGELQRLNIKLGYIQEELDEKFCCVIEERDNYKYQAEGLQLRVDHLEEHIKTLSMLTTVAKRLINSSDSH